MNTKPITQHYWQANIVQPPKPADKPRREKRSFAAIYKAQTTKRERKVHVLVVLLFLIVVGVQIGIAAREITRPMYLSDFVR